MATIEQSGAVIEGNQPSSIWGRGLVALSDMVDRMTIFCFVWATVAFATIMLVAVFFRYVLNSSLSWSDELALIVFAWATFLAIASGYLHDKHVNVNFLVQKMPAGWLPGVKVLAEGLSGGYLISLTVSGIMALDIVGRAHTDAMQLPVTVPYLAIPVACLIMDLHWARRNLAQGPRRDATLKLLIGLAYFWVVFLPIGQYAQITGASRAALVLLALFGPMLIGVPLALSLGLMATLYQSILGVLAFHTGAVQVFWGINVLTLMAVPLLVLAGRMMHAVGMAKLIVDFAQVLVGRVRGGLGVTNVLASFLFGDISGSAVSDTAAIGSLMIPQMKARGYRADFCAALQGTAGTLGMMAPLAISVLLYCAATNTSVSRLAAATIAPSFLVACSFIVVTLVHSRRYNYPKEKVPFALVVPRSLAAIPPLFGLALLVVGIVGGVVTPAEIGSALVAYVLVLSVFFYRRVGTAKLYGEVVEAGYISAMMLFMTATSVFVGFMLARDVVSVQIADLISQITTNRLAVIFIVSGICMILGMILEPPAIIFGFLPSFMPLLAGVGVDPVHWGVLFITNMGLGCIVPPVAMNLFVSTQIAGVRYEQAVRAAVPFMLIMAVDIVIMAVFPQIPLQLPHILFGYPIR